MARPERRSRRSLAPLALAALAALFAACSGPPSLAGTVLSSSSPAPGFELRDQFGQPASLSDSMGRVVVLTFLYTHCPDICPIVTSHLRDAHRMLGDAADGVSFLAVSVDPERDTVERAHAYSEDWGMLNKWRFLTGSEAELSAVWSDYYIDPATVRGEHGGAEPGSGHSDRGGATDSLQSKIAARYNVVHSAPVYLIDREGAMRSLFTLPIDPAEIVHDVRLLLD